jgi:glycosyltransferase involved in cell wall biosynthesis
VTQAPVPVPPQITVVITAFNRAHLLPRALRSLLSGGDGVSHEAIIVDDGSTDDTAAVVGGLLRDPAHPTLRYLYQPNGGLVSARNSGIAAARAPWVTFLDSDDEYAPGHLACRLPLINASSAPDIVHGGLTIVGGPDWVPDKFDPTRRIPIADCFVGGTFLFRRTLWQQLGGFRLPNYGDDHDFMTRAMAAGARVVRCDAPTYIYHRDSPDGLCNTR